MSRDVDDPIKRAPRERTVIQETENGFVVEYYDAVLKKQAKITFMKVEKALRFCSARGFSAVVEYI